MSTDDSVSEDVSSSAAVGADGDAGKESEASLVSSEGTSAVSEDRHTGPPTAGDPAERTQPRSKIRSLCLRTDEVFEEGKSLPFINPSSLETLRVLMKEIQSSGETDPEIWKDCEGRWLHLFQLVEKQYQDQILAQQEQYQCQIQLIQDEIKALVQLQNRQASVHPHTDFSTSPLTKCTTTTKDYMFPIMPCDCTVLQHVPGDGDGLAEERATTVLSSGYGTLSAWEAGPEPARSPGGGGEECPKPGWSRKLQEESGDGRTMGVMEPNLGANQQTPPGSFQQLTSWAQRHKLRTRKSRSQPWQCHPVRDPAKPTDSPDQHPPAQPSSGSSPLKRSDSLMSEASGLTYWRLNECELYRPLPDSLDSGAYLLLQEASLSLPPSQESRLSLREIYQSRRRDCERRDWDGSASSSPPSPQALTLDPAATTQPSDRTSGFTSPSRFSSPSPAAAAQPYPRVETPVTPDSMADGGPNPGDTDGNSDASSVSAAGPAHPEGRRSRGGGSVRSRETSRRQRRASEDDGSHTHTSTLRPCSGPGPGPPEDPVVFSLLRQNLREKHSRHVADLKAYYESEIQILRDKLELQHLPQDLETSHRALAQRCKHLEKALAEATGRVQELEAANSSLEKKLAEWPERYATAAATAKMLQQRLDDGKRSSRDRDALTARLKARVRQLEEAALEARREAGEKEARREREYQMLQDLLGEYECLTKEHKATKNKLVSAESRLLDANDHISDLKGIVTKLESQVKQLEHENQARSRHPPHSGAAPSGAGLFHHPDLLLSPGNSTAEPDASRRKSSGPPSRATRSPLPPNVHRRAAYPGSDQSPGTGSPLDAPPVGGSWRCASPPEAEQNPTGHPEQRDAGRRDGSSALTPVMRALIELEETRATESRAPWSAHQRTTVGFVERRLKEPIQDRAELLQADREAIRPGGTGTGAERGGPTRAERAVALLRAQRSLSPEGHRSSSLPPAGHANVPPATPTKRELLLVPLSAKSSPKRCPTENFSTAFGHLMPREEHLLQRPDGALDKRRHSFHSSSSKKRLQFSSADDLQESSVDPLEGNPRLGREEQRASAGPDLLDCCEDWTRAGPDRPRSLAEAERLFDELTQEKLQVEAALSRMPAGGGRVSLQTRLDEVALETRLERLNRDLGSLRMTLKRFHVLRSSANI